MGFKAKLFEIMLYPDSYDFNQLPVVLEQLPGLRDYAFCVHDRDEGKKVHCHVMLRMTDTRDSDNVAKWFAANSSQVEKCKGRWADMLAYLTHANAPDKFQYEPECVHSNFDWQNEALKASHAKGEKRLNELLEGIGSGELREFNIFDHMTIQEWSKYKTRLKSGFEYRVKMMKGATRDMKSVYVYGNSGTGKTTWAKDYAEQRGYSVYISSGSNDVLDGYEGQDCLILDDLRPSCLGLSDLLKMLDPHTSSTVKSRYYNKVLECKLIIITTTLPMEKFFRNVFENESEPLKQLERRCGTVIHLTQSHMYMSVYQPKTGRYRELPAIPNTVLMKFGLQDQTEDELEVIQAELVGVTIDELRRMRETDTPESNKAGDVLQGALDIFGAEIVDSDKVPF